VRRTYGIYDDGGEEGAARGIEFSHADRGLKLCLGTEPHCVKQAGADKQTTS
jgi:hypothetical protein